MDQRHDCHTPLIWIQCPHPIVRSTRSKQYANDGDEGARNEDHAGHDELVHSKSVDDSLIEEEHVELERPDEDDIGGDASTKPLSDPNIGFGFLFSHGLAFFQGQCVKVCMSATDVCRYGHHCVYNLFHKFKSDIRPLVV